MTSDQNKNNMADSEERRSLISRFVNVSGVSEERAKFFLESASWNLEVGHFWWLWFLSLVVTVTVTVVSCVCADDAA